MTSRSTNKTAQPEKATKPSKAAKPATKAPAKAAKKPAARPALKKDEKSGVVLLSGGNPQIAKGDGDAPVQAYISAMPGWKQDVGRYLDDLIVRTVPHATKAVKWNTPFYGLEGKGFFIGFHCLTKYVKVSFFQGVSMKPIPPGESKQKDVRYLDIYENDKPDEKQLANWILQASKLPCWTP